MLFLSLDTNPEPEFVPRTPDREILPHPNPQQPINVPGQLND